MKDKETNLFGSIIFNKGSNRHPKCKCYQCNHYLDPIEYDCEYNTTIDCDECKYNGRGGRKDPEAKCNQ
jgi:glycine/serine hydroxymethyltransferase